MAKESKNTKIDLQDVSLVIPSDARYLKIVRSLLESTGELLDFPERDIHALVLAANEACANIIKHAYHQEPNHEITIKIGGNTNSVRIELHDQGSSFDPDRIKSRKLKDIRPGGLGIHLMRTLMDQVLYGTENDDGNRLILIKERSKEDDKIC
jgi:serine/threonine-protein kinase RsbW